jgi:hypothetical protein
MHYFPDTVSGLWVYRLDVAERDHMYSPCRLVIRVHPQPRPKCLLKIAGLLPGEAIRQLDPSVLDKMINLLLRELVLLFCVRHLVHPIASLIQLVAEVSLKITI